MSFDNDKRIKQLDFLNQLEMEIKTLEYQVKHPTITNLKIGMVRNLTLSSKLLREAIPFILTASIMIGVFKFTGLGFPFARDLIKYPSNIRKDLDSFGNVNIEQQYDSFGYSVNVLKYYQGWERKDNGIYVRNVDVYELEFFSDGEIERMINTSDIELNDILGEPTYSYLETSYDLSSEEFNKNPYMEATVYIEDTNDYIVKEEPVVVNATTTFFYVIGTLMLEAAVFGVKLNRSALGIRDYTYAVNDKYKPIDVDILSKKLEIKKDNYNRLVR